VGSSAVGRANIQGLQRCGPFSFRALLDFCVTKTKSSSRRGGARRTRNLVRDELTPCGLRIRPTYVSSLGSKGVAGEAGLSVIGSGFGAADLPIANRPLLEQAPAIRGTAPHSTPLEFSGFDSEFTLEPRGDQVAMGPGAAGFDLPAALPAAEDRRRAVAGERA
jgi:hypothetical protein